MRTRWSEYNTFCFLGAGDCIAKNLTLLQLPDVQSLMLFKPKWSWYWSAVTSFTIFLASQDALEVMLVSESVSESLTLRTELTDVTLVSEDTY